MSKNDDVGSKIFGANFSDENREALKKALIQKLSPNGEKPIVEYRLSFDTTALMTQMEDANKALLSQFEIAKKAEKTAVDAERSNAQQLQQEFNGARVAAEAAKKATTALTPMINQLKQNTDAINSTLFNLENHLSSISDQKNAIATLSDAITGFKTDQIVSLTTLLGSNTTLVGDLQSTIGNLSPHFENIESAKNNTAAIKENLGQIEFAQIERLVGLIKEVDKTEKDAVSNCLDEIQSLLGLENTSSSNLQSLLKVKSYLDENLLIEVLSPVGSKGTGGAVKETPIDKIISSISNGFKKQSHLTIMAVVAQYILCSLLVWVLFSGVFADKSEEKVATKEKATPDPITFNWELINIDALRAVSKKDYSTIDPKTSPLSPKDAIQELTEFTGTEDNTVTKYCVGNKVRTNTCKLLSEVQTSAVFYDYVVKENCKSASSSAFCFVAIKQNSPAPAPAPALKSPSELCKIFVDESKKSCVTESEKAIRQFASVLVKVGAK